MCAHDVFCNACKWSKNPESHKRCQHAKTKAKKINNITNQMFLTKTIPTTSPGRRRKQIVKSERQEKRGSDTEKNLQKTMCVKVNNVATENDEGMRKTIEENKASGETHM